VRELEGLGELGGAEAEDGLLEAAAREQAMGIEADDVPVGAELEEGGEVPAVGVAEDDAEQGLQVRHGQLALRIMWA
jgi:hypothetical protein